MFFCRVHITHHARGGRAIAVSLSGPVLQATKSDAHPDAIACRLRLTLVCIEARCADAAPSDDKDYAAYVAKVRIADTCTLQCLYTVAPWCLYI